jgi:hypothetical protein
MEHGAHIGKLQTRIKFLSENMKGDLGVDRRTSLKLIHLLQDRVQSDRTGKRKGTYIFGIC